MPVLDVKDLCISFGDRTLFENVNFQLNDTSKVALVGYNGTGKTTLFNIIASHEKPDLGEVVLSKGARLEYLEQKISNVDKQKSLIDALMTSNFKDGVEEFNKRKAVDLMIKGLGFRESEKNKKCGDFSPGWQMRISLASVLLSEPDFMLLDEPTNYLDIESRVFLADYLSSLKGGYMVVSHDKFFLDKVCNSVYELTSYGFFKYRGNYSGYEAQKALEMENLRKNAERNEKERQEILEFAEKFRSKATKARQVQERLKRLEKLGEVNLYTEKKNVHFDFGASLFSPNDVLTITGLCKSYGEHQVIKDLDLYVKKGERLAVIGQNGKGKSTLLKLIVGAIGKDAGDIKMHASIELKYFSQETDATLNPDNTLVDELRGVASVQDEPRLRGMLAAFGFVKDDIDKKVGVLSGGEKSRLALLKLLLHRSNLLVLDEVTNHLDIPTKQVLLEALKAYNGSIIFVSHDVDFIKSLATNILYFDEKGQHYYNADYDYFLYRQEQDKLNSKSAFESGGSSSCAATSKVCGQNDSQSAFVWSRKERNRATSNKRLLEKLEAQISSLEEQISREKNTLDTPEVYSDVQKSRQVMQNIQALSSELEVLEEQWLSLQE